MGSRLPAASGRDVVRAFEAAGFELVRVNGSHHIMKKGGHPNLLSVPVHGNQPVKRGTLHSLIGNSGLSVSEFVVLLHS